MKLNKKLPPLLLALLVSLMMAMPAAATTAAPGPQSLPVETVNVTCADLGYTGMKLEWCKNICERGYTGTLLNIWIRRWIERYRTLPYCALE